MERLVRELFLAKGSGFVLKGGGALRALFGEERRTKDIDLDFTNPERTAESLHNSVSRAIKVAARGLPVSDFRVSTPGKAERTPRWKINFEGDDGRTHHVEVEVSRDPGRAAPGAVVQQPFVPRAAKGISRFWVDTYDRGTLIATKLAALLGRGAPRDVYDLDSLIATSSKPEPRQVDWAIRRANLEGRTPVEALHERLDALTWVRYRDELRDSLAEEVAGRIDEQEWAAMKQRVAEFAEAMFERRAGATP